MYWSPLTNQNLEIFLSSQVLKVCLRQTTNPDYSNMLQMFNNNIYIEIWVV